MNKTAYEPQVISIGPLHHGRNQELIASEKYKLQGLHNFLRRMDKEKSLKDPIEIAQSWVIKVCNCYAEPIEMKDEKFVTMLLVDGCFMVEFFILFHEQRTSNSNEGLSSFYQGIISDVYFDLIKLENQLPFFFLQHLFDLIPKQSTISFLDLTLEFLVLGWEENYNGKHSQLQFTKSEHHPDHLVHILNTCYNTCTCVEKIENKKKKKNFFSFLCGLWHKKKQDEENSEDNWWIPPSITELWESGVTIKKHENSQSKTNTISFRNGVLEILPLVVDAYFETIIRNLIAYEHLIYIRSKNMSLTSYVLYLDSLISTEKDVRLLVNVGIIINDIGGSNEEVSQLFNNLGKIVTGTGNAKIYLREFNCISKVLCEHCSRRWNKSKASLQHNYFNTPWASVSFFAATFLLLLTIFQTILSVVSTFQ